jgi:hypothetical protein
MTKSTPGRRVVGPVRPGERHGAAGGLGRGMPETIPDAAGATLPSLGSVGLPDVHDARG